MQDKCFLKKLSTSSELRLTNNKEKDIIKVTKSLEGRGILLKGATKKINNQKGRLLIFFYYNQD